MKIKNIAIYTILTSSIAILGFVGLDNYNKRLNITKFDIEKGDFSAFDDDRYAIRQYMGYQSNLTTIGKDGTTQKLTHKILDPKVSVTGDNKDIYLSDKTFIKYEEFWNKNFKMRQLYNDTYTNALENEPFAINAINNINVRAEGENNLNDKDKTIGINILYTDKESAKSKVYDINIDEFFIDGLIVHNPSIISATRDKDNYKILLDITYLFEDDKDSLINRQFYIEISDINKDNTDNIQYLNEYVDYKTITNDYLYGIVYESPTSDRIVKTPLNNKDSIELIYINEVNDTNWISSYTSFQEGTKRLEDITLKKDNMLDISYVDTITGEHKIYKDINIIKNDTDNETFLNQIFTDEDKLFVVYNTQEDHVQFGATKFIIYNLETKKIELKMNANTEGSRFRKII